MCRSRVIYKHLAHYFKTRFRTCFRRRECLCVSLSMVSEIRYLRVSDHLHCLCTRLLPSENTISVLSSYTCFVVSLSSTTHPSPLTLTPFNLHTLFRGVSTDMWSPIHLLQGPFTHSTLSSHKVFTVHYTTHVNSTVGGWGFGLGNF